MAPTKPTAIRIPMNSADAHREVRALQEQPSRLRLIPSGQLAIDIAQQVGRAPPPSRLARRASLGNGNKVAIRWLTAVGDVRT